MWLSWWVWLFWTCQCCPQSALQEALLERRTWPHNELDQSEDQMGLFGLHCRCTLLWLKSIADVLEPSGNQKLGSYCTKHLGSHAAWLSLPGIAFKLRCSGDGA